MSVRRGPFQKWDLERFFWTDPLLSVTERAVARQLLACMDKKFRPHDLSLQSQALTGARVGCWRESVNRAVRKLCLLGYFRKRWITVQRKTLQGIKGVTRCRYELGPVSLQLVENESGVSAAHAHGVTSHHSPRTPLGEDIAVGHQVIANSTDRKSERAGSEAESKRNALASWPRLAGEKQAPTDPAPRSIPIELIRDPAAYRAYLDELEQDMARRVKTPRR